MAKTSFALESWGWCMEKWTRKEEISFYPPSLRGPATKQGREEYSSLLLKAWFRGPAPSWCWELDKHAEPQVQLQTSWLRICTLTRFLFKFQRRCSPHLGKPFFPAPYLPSPTSNVPLPPQPSDAVLCNFIWFRLSIPLQKLDFEPLLWCFLQTPQDSRFSNCKSLERTNPVSRPFCRWGNSCGKWSDLLKVTRHGLLLWSPGS